MTKPCDKCCSTGFTIGMPDYRDTSTAMGGFPAIPCKKCGGTGYYDPDKPITVPADMVKEEYWEKQ